MSSPVRILILAFVPPGLNPSLPMISDLGLPRHEQADPSDPLCWDSERGAPGAPTQGGREDLCFPTSPVELGAQAGTAKLLSPCTQGPACTGGNPPGVGKHLTAEPCNGRLAAWAAGGNGREFRSPLEQGSAGRGRVPSRLMSLGTQVHGRPAAWAACARESRARKGSVETAVSETQVHGLLAARAAGGDGYHSRGAVFGRATKLKVCRR